MSYSYADQATLNCPHCGQPFTAEVWLIVDTNERPDLLQRLQDETLHLLVCPHCGQEATLDAALLILRLEGDPVLIFSPARRTDEAQNREQALSLVQMLRQTMGETWEDTWLADGLPGVPRAALGALLREEPEAVAELEAARQPANTDDIPPVMVEALQEVLTVLAAEGVRVNSALDLEQALASRPELRARMAAAQEEVVAGAMPALRQAMDQIMRILMAEGQQVNSPEELEQILARRPDLLAILEAAGGGLPD